MRDMRNIIIFTAIIHLHLHCFAIAISALPLRPYQQLLLPTQLRSHPTQQLASKHGKQHSSIHPASECVLPRLSAMLFRCMSRTRPPSFGAVSGESHCVGLASDLNHKNECVVAGEVVTTMTFGAISAGDRESRG